MEVMGITPLFIGLLILFSLLGVLVLGGVIVLAVETSRRGAHKILERRTEQLGEPLAPGASAVEGTDTPYAPNLLRQVRITQDLLERADAVGAPIGELRQQMDDLTGHATQVEEQLKGFDPHRAEEEPELLEQLRRRADVISQTLVRIRSYLAQEEANRSNAELADTVGRVQIETEALTSIRGQDPLTEIEHLHRLATEANDQERE